MKMKNRHKRTWLTIFCTIVLLTLTGFSNVYGQSTSEFAGTWNTVTSKGKKIVITLSSTNRRISVSGTYSVNGLTANNRSADRPGNDVFVTVSYTAGVGRQSLSTINGTVTDNVLRFKWAEDGGRGAGRFTMAPDGESFTGTFSKTDNPDDASGGTWNGTRAPNFNGAWQTASFPQIVLQQSGFSVVGQLFPGRTDLGVIRDGVVTGNTLRFTIWRSSSPLRPIPDQYMGAGELVMDKGSKSFKGTLLGAPVTGTRLGR